MASVESVVTKPAPAAAIDLAPARPATSLWRNAWRRLLRNKPAVASMMVIALLMGVAVFAGVIAPYSFEKQDLDHTDEAPTAVHLFGTDDHGRDLFSRIIYGSRISLAVAIVDILIVLLIGVPLGLAAGFFGGRFDTVVMRLVDVLYAFPNLLLIIVVMTYLRALLDTSHGGVVDVLSALDELTGGLIGVFLALAVLSWLTVARLVRGQVLSLKQKEFIEATRAIGSTDRRIIFGHLLPNAMAPIIIAATFGIPGAIATEAGLSFLGLGVRPPYPSWGVLIAEGVRAMRAFPFLLIFPGGMLALTLICFNFLGDGLRDALDPQMKM